MTHQSIKSVLLFLPVLCSAQQFSFSRGSHTYSVTVTSEISGGLVFAGHWLYEPSVVLPSWQTNNEYVMLFSSNLIAYPPSFPTSESIFMNTSPDGLNWGSPTPVLGLPPNICDMADARPVYDDSAGIWRVFVQGAGWSGTSCDFNAPANMFEATGPTLNNLCWYGSTPNNCTAYAQPLNSSGNIGEDFQWFNTSHYNGPAGSPFIDFYNDWDFTNPDYSYCPTCNGNGTDMFAYLSPDAESSFAFWYYTSPAWAASLTAGNGYVFPYPDVMLGATADEPTLGPPALAFGADCQNGQQIGRGVGFYPTPVPNNTQNPSLPGQWIEGNFLSSSTYQELLWNAQSDYFGTHGA